MCVLVQGVAEQGEEQREEKGEELGEGQREEQGVNEVITLHTNCSNCQSPVETRMKLVGILE